MQTKDNLCCVQWLNKSIQVLCLDKSLHEPTTLSAELELAICKYLTPVILEISPLMKPLEDRLSFYLKQVNDSSGNESIPVNQSEAKSTSSKNWALRLTHKLKVRILSDQEADTEHL